MAATPADFDLLVSDIGMPSMDGYQLIREVRGLDGPNRRVPAIALTAYATREDRRRALDAGYDEHLAKPLEPRSLLEVAARLSASGPES